MAMTVFSLGIKSSMEISNSSYPIEVLLSSPYLSAMVRISSRITLSSRFLSARIAFNSLIFICSSLNSFSRRSRSMPVSWYRRMLTISCACTSENSKVSIRVSFASTLVLDARIMRITSSITSRAFKRPDTMWALASALFKSYCVLLVTTSS